ncbi:MAG: hypothetical protein JO097_18230 [Acidobacteriaceae bacterium]|nr:hypothetical protein [Acidobacteriaceae bacterium]MBV9294559.1 hypothetical protein [Acidobacteriaceae bacterium]MBV9765499.1 hypothetical protein [Acidobacteriaceae bacterium]
MQHKIRIMAFAGALMTAGVLLAGGFALGIGKPSANPEAQAKSAVLVVVGYACHDADKTSVTATAEGIVNGKRETIPLKLIVLSGQSTYAVTRQWPAEGKWVITLVEANSKFNGQPSAILRVDGDTVDFAGVTRLTRAPEKTEIEAALNTTAVASKF